MQQIPGRTKPFQTGGGVNYSLTQRKHGIVIFLALRLTEASTKPDFCFLLTLIVKNAVHLDDGDIWLQLVVSVSNLGLRLSERVKVSLPVDAGAQKRLRRRCCIFLFLLFENIGKRVARKIKIKNVRLFSSSPPLPLCASDQYIPLGSYFSYLCTDSAPTFPSVKNGDRAPSPIFTEGRGGVCTQAIFFIFEEKIEGLWTGYK